MKVKGQERTAQIVVLYGGSSEESAISIKSGKNFMMALDHLGIDYTAINPADANWHEALLAINPCYVFLALHGAFGEDGTVQGFLETHQFAYSGSNILGSALAMDKAKAKHIWQSHGLPTLPFFRIEDMSADTVARIEKSFQAPYCLKTVNGGSSIGIEKVQDVSGLVAAYDKLVTLGADIIVEPWIENIREYTVGIMHEKALPVIEIVAGCDFYDYEAKYVRGDTQYICPCDLSTEEAAYIQDIGLRAFNALGCSHWGRIDFIRTQEGEWFILEANTIPGMTEKSLVPMAARQTGLDFYAFVSCLLPQYVADNCTKHAVSS